MSFLSLYFYFIVLCFFVSLSSYYDSRNKYLRLFPPFLLVTSSAEFISSYVNYKGQHNVYIYNFFSVCEFSFYLVLMSFIIRNKRVKRISLIASGVYGIISFINIIFVQGINTFHTVTYSLGCLLIVAVCFYYFFELFRSPKSVRLSVDPAFWICSGLLFFYCCGFPLYAFLNFWARFIWMALNFQTIVSILNIFLYSLFTIAFLCNRIPKYTSSSS